MLKLDELFRLFEELEKSGVLSELSKSAVETDIQDMTIKIPRLYISEKWGDQGDPDRSDLILALKSAGVDVGKEDPMKSLQKLENGLTQTIEELKTKTSSNPGKVLSQLVVFDTINRLFNSFQSSPLGFINEAFMSALYGGQQVKTGEGNKEQQIGDILDPSNVPVSVKTLSPNTPIKGSMANLSESIKNSPNGKVYFDIFVKRFGDKEGSIVAFDAFRFHIDEKIARQEQIWRENPLKEELSLHADASRQNVKQFLDLARKTNWNKEEISKTFGDLSEPSTFIVPKGTVSKRNVELYWDLLRKILSNPERLGADVLKPEEENDFLALRDQFLLDRETSIKAGENQFEIKIETAKILSNKQGYQKVELNFSKERLNEALKLALDNLQKSVFSLFSQVDDFSKKINAYFMSDSPDRANRFGQPAIQSANKVKETTEETIEK